MSASERAEYKARSRKTSNSGFLGEKKKKRSPQEVEEEADLSRSIVSNLSAERRKVDEIINGKL